MDRADVYDAIDSERKYQDTRWESKNEDYPDNKKSIADWILYMEEYLDKAKERTLHMDFPGAMDEIRKVTALGVVCMEYKGVSKRK